MAQLTPFESSDWIVENDERGLITYTSFAKAFRLRSSRSRHARRMTIRAKTTPRRTTHIDLESGSLFVMDYATQLHYTHGVAKTEERVGERISLAFRVKPDRMPPEEPGTGIAR